MLLPQPRSCTLQQDRHLLQASQRIELQTNSAADLLGVAQRLQAALLKYADVAWSIAAAAPSSTSDACIILRIGPELAAHQQGYGLRVTPTQIVVEATTPAGIFYGVCTLSQLLLQAGRALPCLHIADWPDFAVRGVMLDVSRDKVPTMATLYELVDLLASWKINQLQLYTEHTFAYRQHGIVWANASPFTGEEILELDRFCAERFIELVPNQNTFGHMERWLVHEPYAALAETHELFATPWGVKMQGPFSLCPLDPGSQVLVHGLFDELLPHFSSRLFNIGGDETFDVGQGRSRDVVAEQGAGRVYLDYLLKTYEAVKARGHTMQFWGDIIIQHPDLIRELPPDVIALEWGYEADHPFATTSPQYADSGLPFYVCPGTSSWCSLAGRTDNALANLASAAASGLDSGAIGYLITDWGDRGHWQMLPVSYLGFVAGAAYAWAWNENHDLDIAQAVSLYAFRDPTGSMGRVAVELGNIYRIPGLAVPNGSALFWMLQHTFDELAQRPRKVPEPHSFQTALTAIDQALRPLVAARMQRNDASLVIREYEFTARLMRHACHRGLLATDPTRRNNAVARRELDADLQAIIQEYQELWLARNRRGGLADSVARLQRARVDYQA